MRNQGIHNRSLNRPKLRILLWFLFITVLFCALLFIVGYIRALKPVSYLPEDYSSDLETGPTGINKIELTNPWYILSVDDQSRLSVKSNHGEIIMSSLTFYSEYDGTDGNWGLENVKVKSENDSTISISGICRKNVNVNISLTAHKNQPKLDVNIRAQYNLRTLVYREALVAKFDIPISEIYLKNRKIDVKPFNREYWLDNQGVRFGSGSKSSLIYHNPQISSLQLDTKENLLFFNLEYFKDHPHIYIPYQKDGGKQWSDHSMADYSEGMVRNNCFSIYFGTIPAVTPRLMMVPEGYIAGYVFTEHADSGNIRTNRAAYFGSESVTDIDDAVGGFAKYKIPVTKSVFYADTSIGHPLVSTIRDGQENDQFLNFLDQLYSTGLYDICLHTPEWYNSNRETMTEALKFMKDRFNTITWIDHGMLTGKINRETFVCDGLDSSSQFYSADLWQEYNINYFWNTVDEKIIVPKVSLKEEIKSLRFVNLSAEFWKRYMYQKKCNGMTSKDAFLQLFKGNSSQYEPNSLQPFRGSSYPTPIYWLNPTRTMKFYSWITNYTDDYKELSDDRAEAQIARVKWQLDLLLNDWGIFINHSYFVRNRKGYDTTIESNGKIIVNPYFDKILEFMSGMRGKGDLYITTVRDLLNYWILLDNICFEYLPNGEISIINANDKTVKGLSLALAAKEGAIQIKGAIPLLKQIGENTIVWFDMPPKAKVTLQVNSKNEINQY